MSNRPDWCPADVWEAAQQAWREAGFINDRLGQVQFIARAILAERKRCEEEWTERLSCELRDAEDRWT